MMNTLTHDGAIVMIAIGAIAIIYALWIALQAIQNNGVARVWWPLMFGWGGITIAPWLVLISTSAEATIPAHEQIHVKQMRELGPFGFAKFWWRYLTDKQQRLMLVRFSSSRKLMQQSTRFLLRQVMVS